MARRKTREVVPPRPEPSKSREFFLARCDVCNWQERTNLEEEAGAALAAHVEELHDGKSPTSEENGGMAQVVKVEVEKAVAVAE